MEEKRLTKTCPLETLLSDTGETSVSYIENNDILIGYSAEEVEAIIRMKKKYPSAIIPKIDKKTGKAIFPSEIAEDWD